MDALKKNLIRASERKEILTMLLRVAAFHLLSSFRSMYSGLVANSQDTHSDFVSSLHCPARILGLMEIQLTCKGNVFDYQTVFVHVAFLFLSSASIPIHLVSTTRPQAANKKVIEYRLLRNISTYNYYTTPRISTCVVHAMMYGLLGRFP